MGLIDLISPKWKHSNPDVRINAVKQLGVNDVDILRKIATTDKVALVRKTATEKISSKEILEEIAKKDSDNSVILTARRQLDFIYRELIFESDDKDACKLFLDEITDETIVASIACRIDDPEIRLFAVGKISDESLLCMIAESNCGVIAGDAIVDKISNPDVLQRISEKASNKKTRKKALDKLDAMVEKEEAPSIEKDKQTALENILNSVSVRLTPANWEKGGTLLHEAETQWKAHDPKGEHPLFIAFSDAVKTLKKQMAAYESRSLTIKLLEGLISEIEALTVSPSIESREQAHIIRQKWQEIDKKNIPYTTSQDFERRFDLSFETVMHACERTIEAQEKYEKNVKQMNAILEKAEKLLDTGGLQNINKDVDNLLNEWPEILSDASEISSLKERFENVVREIKERHAAYLREIEKDRKEQERRLHDILSKVQQASADEDTMLFKSAGIVKKAKNEWKEEGKDIPEIKNQMTSKFQDACDTFYTRLNEYRQNREWEMWANLTQKTELCEIIESIGASFDSGTELGEPAKLVREAQEKWKTIGPVTRDKSDEIWARFRQGCDKVFSQCFEKKQALYADLTEAVEISNYAQASEKVKQIQKDWNAVGILPISIEKELRDSFQSVCDRFFEEQRDFFKKRDDERYENLKIKTSLCEEAELLSTSSEWNTTADKLKQIQMKWKETGAIPRKEGDALWSRFQNACNMFFDNLERVKPENLSEKQAICDQVEALIAGITDDANIEDASKQVIELQRQWKTIGPVPKEHITSIWERFNNACEEIFNMRREYYRKREDQWAVNKSLKEKLVIEAEALSDSMDWEKTPDRLKAIQAEWKKIPSGPRKEEQSLWERLRTACDTFFSKRRIFFEDIDNARQENLKKKESLCLTLELLTKFLLEDSTMDYNEDISIAEQLSKAMELRDEVVVPGEESVTRNNIIRKIKQVQAEWKEVGPVPNNYDRDLWQRFKKAGDLLYSLKKD